MRATVLTTEAEPEPSLIPFPRETETAGDVGRQGSSRGGDCTWSSSQRNSVGRGRQI